MLQAKIIETNLDFYGLNPRNATNLIVIHHTGTGGKDLDMSAAQIHDYHLSKDWAGIGYHFVVRKDGSIERGRPEWAVGSHAYGRNQDTLGIHLSGEYNSIYYPPEKQIESTALLIANLCAKYNLPIDRQHIIGHCEVDPNGPGATSCPGKNLYAKLDLIVGKANWYRYNSADVIDTPVDAPKAPVELDNTDVAILKKLSAKYESGNNPAKVANDVEGLCYGTHQLSSAHGSVQDFVEWLKKYPDDDFANYGRKLGENEIDSPLFIQMWKSIGTIDPGNFGKLQDEYIKATFYDAAVAKLGRKLYHVSKHWDALKAVVWSRAVQNGITGCVVLFETACQKLGHPNLSYVDDGYHDDRMINAIYDYLIAECDLARPDGSGIYHSPDDFCRGSLKVIDALRNRFVHERADALAMLTGK